MERKVALVTGASSGIGKASAERLAEAGYTVYATSRRAAPPGARSFEMLSLDVTSARAIRVFVKEWIAEKPDRTLLLTTHYMAEADELCDRLAIIDKGKVLACDTPANLKRQVQQYPMYELTLAPSANGWSEVGKLPGVHSSTTTSTPTTVELKVSLHDEPAIGSVVQSLVLAGGRILTMKKVEPTLEDVFIELVGHGLSDEVTQPPSE